MDAAALRTTAGHGRSSAEASDFSFMLHIRYARPSKKRQTAGKALYLLMLSHAYLLASASWLQMGTVRMWFNLGDFMKLLVQGLVLAGMCLSASWVHGAEYALPKNSNAPVITLDFQGSRLQRLDSAPAMSILADGRVVLPKIYPHSQAYVDRISDAELQSLLGFIIEDQGFFATQQKSIDSRVNAANGMALPVHAPISVVRVTTADQTNEVRLRGVGSAASDGAAPEIAAIMRRLEKVMSTAKLGGAEGVNALLQVANQNLARDQPGAAPLTAADLYSAGVRLDGSKTVQFVRNDAAGPVHVVIHGNPSGQLDVSTSQEVVR